MVTFWDEFQQHDASMRQYKELMQTSNKSPSSSTNNTPPKAAWQPPSHPPSERSNAAESWHMERQGGNTAFEKYSNAAATMALNYPPNVTPTSHFGHVSPSQKHSTPAMNSYAPGVAHASASQRVSQSASENSVSQRPLVDFLRRKPIHSWLTSPSYTDSVKKYSSCLKSSVLNLLGVQEPKPMYPGLPNTGRQTCFMNSVLQCMGHIYGLDECMLQELQQLNINAKEKDLVLSAAKMFQQLGAIADSSSPV